MVISMLFIEITDSPADPETERDNLSCQLAPFPALTNTTSKVHLHGALCTMTTEAGSADEDPYYR